MNNSANHDSLASLAQTALDNKQYTLALRYLNALDVINPSYNVDTNIAFCHYHLDDFTSARSIYRKIVKERPDDIQTLNNLAKTSAKLGDLEIPDPEAAS